MSINNNNGKKIYNLLKDIVIFLIIPIFFLTGNTIWNHELRLTAHEATRVNRKEYDEDQRDVCDMIIQSERRIRENVPPPEVRQALEQINQRLARIEDKMFDGH